MALDALSIHLQEVGSSHLMNVIPSPDTMRWVSHSAGSPPEALVIGKSDGRDILAFLIQNGDKPREIRYCATTGNRREHVSLYADDVSRMDLISPFKYIAGTSKSEKRKLSVLVKWYFLKGDIVEDGIGGDYADFCKRFHGALQIISMATQPSRSKQRERRPTTINAKVIRESLEVNESPSNVYNTRNNPRNTSSSPLALAGATMDELEQDPDSDYYKLKKFLRARDALYLLDNIPMVDEVEFKPQFFLPEAQPRKLFVGTHRKTGDPIYAYMRMSRDFHEIKFFNESSTERVKPQQMRSELAAHQRIIHPFNKTYPKDGRVEQSDKARFTLMIKWYFIAAGIAKNCVLKETKAYPARFQEALEYIERRMGGAAAQKPLQASPGSERVNRRSRSDREQPNGEITSTRRIDSEGLGEEATELLSESHIQSALGEITTSPDNPDNNQDEDVTQGQQPIPISTNGPRGTKRSAEDAEFDNLAQIITKDRFLTKQINDMDHKIDLINMQLENLQKQRDKLADERKGVRQHFKRQSLDFMNSSELEV